MQLKEIRFKKKTVAQREDVVISALALLWHCLEKWALFGM